MEINSYNITMRQALGAIKLLAATPDAEPFEIEMAMLGLDYEQYVRVSSKQPNKPWYAAFIGLSEAVKLTTANELLGTKIPEGVQVFEHCSFGAVEAMNTVMRDIHDTAMADYTAPANEPEQMTDDEKAETIARENRLMELYYDNLPKMLGLVVAGIRGEDGADTREQEILDGPAIPALKLATAFFLAWWKRKTLMLTPIFYLYTTMLLGQSATNSSGQSIPRIYSSMQKRGF